MFRKRTTTSDIERKIYEDEIKRLTKERNDFAFKYETANKYKGEYEILKKDYENKLRELDSLKKKANKLMQDLETQINKIKKEQ